MTEMTHEEYVEKGICPECHEQPLSEIAWREHRGECHGTPAYERMSIPVCDYCGWRADY